MTTQPTLLAQQRAILSQLGITLWAGRHTPTTILEYLHHSDVTPSKPVLPEMIDVLAERFAVRQNPKTDNQQSDDQQTKADIVATPQANTQTPVDAQTQTDVTNQTPDSPAVQIAYHLQAIRYQNWLLLADVPQMNADAKAVWLSLNQALKRHAEQNRGVFASRQLQFPFDGIDEQAGNVVQLANSSFLGFVFSMTKADNRVKVCLLTPLPDFLNVNFATVGDFSVSQMAVEANLKKQFWQFLHANP